VQLCYQPYSNMNQRIEKFWKGFRSDERAKAEADAEYRAAVDAGDYTKAEERACEVVKGNFVTPSQLKKRSILSKARDGLNEVLRD
jgi:hypothetical protein